jgi:hypothetical protein
MSDKKITQLTALTGADTVAGDQLAIVDVSDTTMSASGTTKKIALSELQASPISAGTANGVAYLNGSKVLTTGSALTFDGSTLFTPNLVLPQTAWTLGTNSSNASIVGFGGTGSGGTTNTLVFNTNGSEQMRLTSTGLGIGTSSPGARLNLADANGNVMMNGNQISWNRNPNNGAIPDTAEGSVLLIAGTTGGGSLQFWTSSGVNASGLAERMRLDSSGNLGLGVTPSANSLSGSGYRGLEVGSVAGYGLYVGGYEFYAQSNTYYNSGFKYANSGRAALQYVQASGQHQWFTAPSGTAGDVISFTQVMTLDSSGNLGIGTTSPAAPLHVSSTPGAGSASAINLGNAQVGAGSCSINYTSTGFNFAGVGGSEFLLLAADTGPLSLATFASNPIKFITNQTERARIDSSGNLIQTVNTTAATLSTNGTLTFSIVDNSTLRISVRGSDGTTRTATVALT